MWGKVSELSSDQRRVIEGLLGRRLADDEGLNIQPSSVLQDAPAGPERIAAYAAYLDDLNRLGRRTEGVSDDEFDAIADEACNRIRHRAS